ncbi:11-oxo-beta-amyrin 30-oxidase [Seminavis robusta]|uniref:11-oxo-beta-amyrin 30-oxidase n=1 Tax=Seminavis robusta TaxID=568900 RepID=A0A9N8E0U4_9STRA|nr:11-oxo-beta-amyrin 30-oxidase [Seminavis robusta]|eukprot:Sro535_g161910.1 11-oxo-beta-amyrin 30-oxidase (550) ;mRNA; r:11141-12790
MSSLLYYGMMGPLGLAEVCPSAVVLFTTAAVVVLVLVRLRRHLQTKKPFSGIPMAPDSQWLFGHLHLLFAADNNFEEAMTTIHKSTNEYGVTGLWVGRHPVLSVSNVDTARMILQTSSQRHPPAVLKRFLAKFVGNCNIVTLNGAEWKFHRNIVASTFNETFLMDSRRIMRQVAESMVHALSAKIRRSSRRTTCIDLENTMKLVAMDIFGLISLGTDLGSCRRLTPTPLVKAFDFLMEELMDRVRSPWRPRHLFYIIPTTQNRRQRRERRVIRSFVADLLNEKRDILKDGDRDLLSHLVLAHYAMMNNETENSSRRRQLTPRDVSDESITDVLMTLLLAGHHTTSATLTFALYLMAKHPELQQICVQEIRAVASIDENMDQLVYCSAVIWETLRLFPPAVRTGRSLERPVQIGNFVAPTLTRVQIPIWSIHHDEAVFPQPECFRPDRWAIPDNNNNTARWTERTETDTSRSIAAGNRKAMLAFSTGARSCVGQKFALQEAVIVLATLLKDLEFHLVPGHQFKTSTNRFLLRPAESLPLAVSLRQPQQQQ